MDQSDWMRRASAPTTYGLPHIDTVGRPAAEKWAGIVFVTHMIIFGLLSVWAFFQKDNPFAETDLRWLFKPLSGALTASIVGTMILTVLVVLIPSAVMAVVWPILIFGCLLFIFAFLAVEYALGIFGPLGLFVTGLGIYASNLPQLDLDGRKFKVIVRAFWRYPALFLLQTAALSFMVLYLTTNLAVSVILGSLMKNEWSIAGALAAALAFCTLSTFWTGQVVVNMARVIASLTFSTYFSSAEGLPPRPNPTLRGMAKAIRTTFGGICYGSLLLVPVSIMRPILMRIESLNTPKAPLPTDSPISTGSSSPRHQTYSPFCSINYYSFTQMALNGKPFLKAGSDCWVLLESKGLLERAESSLISTFLTYSGLVLTVLASLICAAICNYLNYSEGRMMVAPLLTVALVLTVPFCSLMVFDAGVKSLFICLAEDASSVLIRNHPEIECFLQGPTNIMAP